MKNENANSCNGNLKMTIKQNEKSCLIKHNQEIRRDEKVKIQVNCPEFQLDSNKGIEIDVDRSAGPADKRICPEYFNITLKNVAILHTKCNKTEDGQIHCLDVQMDLTNECGNQKETELMTKIEGLEQNTTELTTKIKGLEQNTTELATKIEGLEQNNTEMTTEIDRLKQINDNLMNQTTCGEWMRNNTELRKKIESLENKIKSFEEKNITLGGCTLETYQQGIYNFRLRLSEKIQNNIQTYKAIFQYLDYFSQY